MKEIQLDHYPSYKNSGVTWLGNIPEGWEVRRLKFLGKLYAGLTGKKGDDFAKEYKNGFKPFIPFTNIYRNLEISDKKYEFVKISPYEYQNKVKKDDILFLMSSETLDDIGKCSIYLGKNIELFLNSFCKGFRFNCRNVQPRYLNLLLSSQPYRDYFSIVGRGFTRMNIKQEYINNLKTPIPPLTEQTAIIGFLNKKCEKINLAISQKEKMIELLKERKQIVIQNAVTKGVNPNAKMKNSGVEWIGEIPEHWDVVRNFQLFSERKEQGNKNLQILSVSIHTAVSENELNDDENIRGKIRIEDKSSYKLVDENDIAFNMMRAWQGGIGSVPTLGMVSPAYIVAKPIGPINTKYFEFQYRTGIFIQQMDRFSKGITDFRKRLYWDEFKQLKTILPPHSEQVAIIDHIKKESVKIDKAVELQQKQIEKLKEYKATLINSAVTGKIKVS
jgi:type I restriction enzyme, S subunit